VSAHGLLSAPPPAPARYEYNLAYQSASAAIPARHYIVRARSLSTVDERFFQAAHTSGGFSMVGFFAWEGGYGGYV
jgi:hypothetical protein